MCTVRAPVPPTSENLLRVRRWLASIELGPNTLPYEAVRQAVKMQPDAIFLLSDGQFKDGGLTELILRNHSPKVIVHTIAFWELAGAAALQRIALESGGTFRFVPPVGRSARSSLILGGLWLKQPVSRLAPSAAHEDHERPAADEDSCLIGEGRFAARFANVVWRRQRSVGQHMPGSAGRG